MICKGILQLLEKGSFEQFYLYSATKVLKHVFSYLDLWNTETLLINMLFYIVLNKKHNYPCLRMLRILLAT